MNTCKQRLQLDLVLPDSFPSININSLIFLSTHSFISYRSAFTIIKFISHSFPFLSLFPSNPLFMWLFTLYQLCHSLSTYLFSLSHALSLKPSVNANFPHLSLRFSFLPSFQIIKRINSYHLSHFLLPHSFLPSFIITYQSHVTFLLSIHFASLLFLIHPHSFI